MEINLTQPATHFDVQALGNTLLVLQLIVLN